ncbi:MAG: thioredoxin [Bacteroidales bacterium]|nr:thioredoxin [Bacteroidales bacterium]
MEQFNQIIQNEGLTLVDFFATWCGPCKTMHPVLEQLKANMGDRLRIIKIDVDKNPSISSTYNIQSVPTLILFKRGEVAWRQSGALGLGQLQSIIEQYQ